MKKLVMLLLLMLTMLSFGAPNRVDLNDNKLSYVNKVIKYSGEPYTGTVYSKEDDSELILNFKNGKLDGQLKLSNPQLNILLIANVVNGKLNGDFISKEGEEFDMKSKLSNGKLLSVDGIIEGENYNVSFNETTGLANGTMVIEGEDYTFKNGYLDNKDLNSKIKLYFDSKVEKVFLETIDLKTNELIEKTDLYEDIFKVSKLESYILDTLFNN